MKEGIFLKECSSRFLCKVLIDNVETECYVPSSAKLKNFLELTKRKVLLCENKEKKARTAYTLEAAEVNNKIIFLNLNRLNSLYEDYLLKKEKLNQNVLKREVRIGKYRADLKIGENKVVEIKGVLSDSDEIIFPNHSSGRAFEQLKIIDTMLDENIEVDYVMILMNPSIKQIGIADTKFSELFCRCLTKGLNLKTFSIKYNTKEFILEKNKSIDFIY